MNSIVSLKFKVGRPAYHPRADRFDNSETIPIFVHGQCAIKIQRIELTPGSLKIFVAERTPGPDSIVTQAFSAPFHFVAVPKNDLKLDFVMEKKSLQ